MRFVESNAVFLVNTVQKRGNIMQKEGNKMDISQRMEYCDWLMNNRNN